MHAVTVNRVGLVFLLVCVVLSLNLLGYCLFSSEISMQTGSLEERGISFFKHLSRVKEEGHSTTVKSV